MYTEEALGLGYIIRFKNDKNDKGEMINKLINKASQLKQLSKEFGLINSIYIQYQLLHKQPVKVNFCDQTVFLNPEPAAAYHLLHSLKKIKNLVDSIPSENCNEILDIGANCGLFSLLARKRFPTSNIYAFEPSNELQKILNLNLASKDVHILPMAVSNNDGYAELFINITSQQTNSLIRKNVELFSDKIESSKVSSIKLDSFIINQNINEIDVLKIDVQGAEQLIIEGGSSALTKTKYLIMEITFMEDKIFDLVNMISEVFPFYKTINPVLYGADILFSKEPLS